MAQLRVIKPHVIVTLGAHAAHAILGERLPMEELRNHYYSVDGQEDMDVVPTFHPMATAYVKARRLMYEEDLNLFRRISDQRLSRDYRQVRQHGRCTLPLDEPQDLVGYGIVL
jgi:uracil-DNA glycosylase family 4